MLAHMRQWLEVDDPNGNLPSVQWSRDRAVPYLVQLWLRDPDIRNPLLHYLKVFQMRQQRAGVFTLTRQGSLSARSHLRRFAAVNRPEGKRHCRRCAPSTIPADRTN